MTVCGSCGQGAQHIEGRCRTCGGPFAPRRETRGPRHITASAKQETGQTVSVEIKDQEMDTVGYLEIVATPKGVTVQGWHGNDSEADGQLVLRKEGHA